MGNLGALFTEPLFSDDLTDVVEEGFPNCIGDRDWIRLRDWILEMFEVVLYNFF